MADSKISDLTDGTAPQDTDAIPIARSTSTLKLLWSELKAAVYAPSGTDVAVADGGTGASTAAGARTNLGLGTLATQSGTFSGTSSGTNTGDQTTVSGNAGTATALQTGRTIDGQTFDGTANITVIAPGTHAATSKTTPVDADELSLVDSAASNVLKKLTWANLKATIKTYTDTLYQASGASAGGDLTGTYPNPTLGTSGVSAATYGDASHVAQVTFDAKGRATSASSIAIAGGSADKLGLTPTSVKTSGYTAVGGDFVPVDTTSGSVTITLPNAPTDGSVVAVKQIVRGGTNTVTVNCAGSDVFNVASGATSATLTLLAHGLLLQYKSSGAIWYVVADDMPLSQIDTRYVNSGGAAGGDLTGTYPNPTLAAAGPGATGPIGNSANIPAVTIDAKGRVTALTSVTPVLGAGIYGDGSDGTVTFDGSTTILSLVPSGSIYTLTRDIFLVAGTINNGVTIIAAGFRIFCQGTLTNNGTIQHNGNTAVGGGSAAAGAALSVSTSTINNAGAGTGSLGLAGGNGAATTGTTAATGTEVGFGGTGGTGGTGTGGAGGAAGSLGTSTILSPRTSLGFLVPINGAKTAIRLQGGTGGGGGGGDSSVSGGGGGGGGGIVMVAAKAFSGTGAIQARGGGGGTRNSGNNGGGGGGGGGLVIVISGSVSSGAISGQTIDANGGSKGSPHGTGTGNAADGNGGSVYLIPN